MAGKFEPKVPVQLAPPKDDPISVEELAKANGKGHFWFCFPERRVPLVEQLSPTPLSCSLLYPPKPITDHAHRRKRREVLRCDQSIYSRFP
jgi:hypothetical protein